MILYLDTSSLVKLYFEEEGSEVVRGLVARAAVVATSVVAYAETRAALARQRREGGVTETEFVQAKADFELDWRRFLTLAVTEPVCRRAGDLAERHRLRGFDSLHLATFLALADASGERATGFSSHDEALNRAARRESRTGRS